MAKLGPVVKARSAHYQLYAILHQYEERTGKRPERLRISERTVRVLAVESDQSLSPLINFSRIEQFVKSAREGTAEFCAIPIEVTH